MEIETKTEVTEVKIGEFKTNEKFLEFVGAKGNLNFLSPEAIIDGKHLSGTVDGIKFKLTICDGNTVDFEEVDTTSTTKEERERLLEIINDKTITSFRSRMVISELPFRSVKGDISLYLSVDYVKPYDKLSSIFDEVNTSEISNDQSSKLDALLDMFGSNDDITLEPSDKPDKSIDVESVDTNEKIKVQVDNTEHLKSTFKKMNDDKVNELKKRIDHNKKEVNRISGEVSQSNKKLEDSKKDLGILESRLESLTPKDELNGYVFNISESTDEKIIFDDKTTKIILDRVAKVGLNPEAFIKLFSSGVYKIKLSVDKKTTIDNKSIPTDIMEKLNSIGIVVQGKELVYSGDLKWHDLINKLIRLGFESDQDFDKICNKDKKEDPTQNPKMNGTYQERDTCETGCGCTKHKSDGETLGQKFDLWISKTFTKLKTFFKNK